MAFCWWSNATVPTCRLITPVVHTLSVRGMLSRLMSQDDPGFPDGMSVIDDRETLIRALEEVRCELDTAIEDIRDERRGDFQRFEEHQQKR